jgi:hypothetical protein
VSRNDTLQMLVDAGDERLVVVGVCDIHFPKLEPAVLIDVFNFTLVHHGPADRWSSGDRDNWYVAYIELSPGYSTD